MSNIQFNPFSYTNQSRESHVDMSVHDRETSKNFKYSLLSENPIAAGANGTVYPIKLHDYDKGTYFS